MCYVSFFSFHGSMQEEFAGQHPRTAVKSSKPDEIQRPVKFR